MRQAHVSCCNEEWVPFLMGYFVFYIYFILFIINVNGGVTTVSSLFVFNISWKCLRIDCSSGSLLIFYISIIASVVWISLALGL